MADTNVETVLREIKERVRAEYSLATAGSNGGTTSGFRPPVADPLARLRANLVITERAWSKLPPVTSFHRTGFSARLEVWVKRQIKRASDWYFYEQINFNGAVNGALHTTASILDLSLKEQRVCLKQLALEMSEQQVVLDRTRRAIDSRLDELEAKLEELRQVERDVTPSRSSQTRMDARG